MRFSASKNARAAGSPQSPDSRESGIKNALLRSDESLSEKWEYVRQNPVRAGLVEHSEDWPYQFQFNA
jgi:hypothetical protein